MRVDGGRRFVCDRDLCRGAGRCLRGGRFRQFGGRRGECEQRRHGCGRNDDCVFGDAAGKPRVCGVDEQRRESVRRGKPVPVGGGRGFERARGVCADCADDCLRGDSGRPNRGDVDRVRSLRRDDIAGGCGDLYGGAGGGVDFDGLGGGRRKLRRVRFAVRVDGGRRLACDGGFFVCWRLRRRRKRRLGGKSGAVLFRRGRRRGRRLRGGGVGG